MNVLVIGAGRMGIRHALGVLRAKGISSLTVSDISETSLENAKKQLDPEASGKEVTYQLNREIKGNYDVVIIAATATDRLETCRLAVSVNPQHILVEKPLGQSFEEVQSVTDFFRSSNVKAYVNLNTRMYPFIRQLKQDLDTWPQFAGPKTMSYNAGSLGIGANGIHWIDLLFFLFGADDAKIVAAEVDPNLIPSGRGPAFGDFGGWCCIKFYKNNHFLGKAILSLSAQSTVYGGWDITGTHGRIRINELEEQRIDILRKPDSEMPLNRYAADYMAPVVSKVESPFLGDLTREWIEALQQDQMLLPDLQDSLKAHRVVFDWLSHSDTHKSPFPIT